MITDGLRKRNKSKATKLHSQCGVVWERVDSTLKLLTLVCLLLFVVAFSANTVSGSTRVTQTYTISGRVADGYGNAISGATVTLSGTQSGTTTADNNGNYSFANLQASGNYNLFPSKAGQYFGFGSPANNLSSDLTVNLRLDPYIKFNIRVTDAGGNGMPGVVIVVDDFPLDFIQTGISGTLTLSVTIAATGNFPPPSSWRR